MDENIGRKLRPHIVDIVETWFRDELGTIRVQNAARARSPYKVLHPSETIITEAAAGQEARDEHNPLAKSTVCAGGYSSGRFPLPIDLEHIRTNK